VARVVWNLGEASVRQVVDALPTDDGADYWTVQTYLRRLADKGYLKVTKKGRTNFYLPKVAPSRVLKKLVDDLLERAFDGETFPLLQHLIQERGLNRDEIEQLQATLDRLKDKRA
jgi:BlaI family penicillinase repressor